MTDKLFGWVMYVTPGVMSEALGYAEVKWEIFETIDGGIDSIESKLPPGWTWELCDFGFADDMQDYAGIHGVIAYKQTNGPETLQYAPLWLGKHNVAAEFVLCGYIDGQPIPFHTEEQAHEVIAWFISKQAQWYDAYSPKQDGEASQEEAAPEADRSAGSAQRGGGKTVH